MKKYTIDELKKLDKKPVYIESLDDTHVFKSGWAIISYMEQSDYVFASNGFHTILLSEFLGKWFEAYDYEPAQDKTSKVYNKIIRDNMQELIESDCKSAEFSIVKGKEKMQALKNKLLEEANEFAETGHISELADVLEVIYAICHENEKTIEDIEKMRVKKKDLKGGFEKGLFLKSIVFNDKE